MRSLKLLVAALALAAVTHVAAPARADEPVRVFNRDRDAVPPSGARGRVALTGGLMLGLFYGASLGAWQLFPDDPTSEYLPYPVVGPWMSFSKLACQSGESGCNPFTVTVRTVGMVILGVGQTGGALALLEALLLPSPEAAPAPGPKARPRESTGMWSPAPGVEVSAAPIALPGGAGLGVAGTF